MQGTMLWFNVDKGYGFIESEQGERLRVESDGFRDNHEPQPRCKGRLVRFERHVEGDEVFAVDVAYTTEDEPRRARLRHARGGSSL
jgi:cold shock CspA family protein